MSLLASFLIRQIGKAAATRFETATCDPVGTQQRKLTEILRRNRDTEYGRQHGFGSISNLADYRKKVPLITYEDIRERMERALGGEQNILTAETPVMFARTSGTTGEAKYIPITPTCRGRDHSDQMRAWTYHAMGTHPRMFRRKAVSMVSPAIEGHTPGGIPYGSTSGLIYRNMPGVVRSTYAIPYEVFLIEDYEAKYYTLMRVAMACEVSFVGTANPSSIIKMCEIADQSAERLIRDIADGTLRGDLEIAPDLRQTIELRLKKDPARARLMEQARRRRKGRMLPVDYWPGLALIGCWKGGTVGGYIRRFSDWFDPDRRGMTPVRDWGYLSSEARGSIPLSDHGSAGVLTVATNVYEFAPVADVEARPDDPSSWSLRGVGDLEEDEEYFIFLTTTGGLYRYDINDVVKVVGLYNKTPTIEFLRKGRGMTNITGEKLSVNQVIEAFEGAARRLETSIDHFKAEADPPNSRYVFKVEAPALAVKQRRSLLEAVDRELSRLNIEYEAKRKSLRLGAPVLHVMRQGWYDRLKQELIADGKRLFQAKTVLLDSAEGHRVDHDNLEAVVTLD